MAIKLENILNVSLTEYCQSNDAHSSYYELVGVHHVGFYNWNEPNQRKSPKEAFAEKVPNSAEAVVGYTVEFIGDFHYEANGVALIPKKHP